MSVDKEPQPGESEPEYEGSVDPSLIELKRKFAIPSPEDRLQSGFVEVGSPEWELKSPQWRAQALKDIELCMEHFLKLKKDFEEGKEGAG